MTPIQFFILVVLFALVLVVLFWPRQKRPTRTDARGCSHCGTSQPHHARFCRKCGKGL